MPRPVVATTDAHFFKRRDQALRCMAPGGALLAITHANPHAPRVFIFLDITLTIPAQKLRLPKGEPETEDTYKVRLSLIVLPPDSTEPHPHMLLPRDNLDEFPHLGRFALYMQSVQRSATSKDPDDPQWSLWLSVHSYRSNKNTAMKFLEIAKRLHELDLPTHSDQDAGVPQQVVSAPVQLYSKHERRKEDRKRKLKEIFPKRAEREDREERAARRRKAPLPIERGMSIGSSSTAGGGARGGEPSSGGEGGGSDGGGEDYGEDDKDEEDVQEDQSLSLAIELPTDSGVVSAAAPIPASQAVSPSMVQAMTNAFQSLPPAMLLAMSNALLQAQPPPKPKPKPKPKTSSASSSPHSLSTATTASAGAGGASSANANAENADADAAEDNIAHVVETHSASAQSRPSDTPPLQSPRLSQSLTSLQTPLLATHTSPPQPPNLDPRVTTLLEVIPYISSMTLEQRRWVVKLILNPTPSAAATAATATTDARSSPAISDAGSVASADASAATAAAMEKLAKSVPPLPPSIPTSSTADLEPAKSPTASEIHERLIRRIMEFNPDMNALSPQQRTLLGLSLDVLNAKKRGRKPKNPNSPPRKRGRPKSASVWAEGGGGVGESSEGEGKKNKGGGGGGGGGGAREDFDYLSMYMPTGIAIGGSNALKPKPPVVEVVDAPTEKSLASAPASDETRVDAATEETPVVVALDELPDAAAAEASDHPPASVESGETLATVASHEEAAAAGAASRLNAPTALTAPSAAPKRAAPTSSAIEGSLRKRAKRSDSSTKKRRSKYDLPSESPMPREWSSTDATATLATNVNNVVEVQELPPITSVTVPGTHVVTSPPPPHPQLQPQAPRQRGAVEQSIIDSQITSLLNIIPHLSYMPVQQRRWVIDNLVHPTTNPATFPALPPLTTLAMPTVSSQDQLCEPTPHQTHAWIVWRIKQLDPTMERMTLEQRGLIQRSWPMPGYNMGGVGQAPRLAADPGPPGVVGPTYGTSAPPPPPHPPHYPYWRPGMPMPQTTAPMHPAYSTPPYQPYANMPMPMMYPTVSSPHPRHASPQPLPPRASPHAHVTSGSPATTASHAPTASPSPHVPPQQVPGTANYTHGTTTSASSSPLMPHEFRNNTGDANTDSAVSAAAALPTFTTTASSESAPPAHVAPI
ncbi:hypothetical protein HDU88_002897 [Geranomyces variabilis]|nr:hypothetical protein HDU88_002897 [Geranomyces variabilis]